jgi:transketolase
MRTAFIETLTKLATQESRVELVVGDLGYSVVDDFATRFPDRFLNAGVAEQNMTGVATGISLAIGSVVFTYSIGNFATARCLEQIRNDVCHHHANVKIVAVGGGVAYGVHGATHFAVEDLALMRALPGIVVSAPADATEARALTRLAVETPGPWYIRLGKNCEPKLHDEVELQLTLGGSTRLREGKDGTLIATGPIAYEAREAARSLAAEGVELRVVSMPFLRPVDTDTIRAAATETPWVMTVEEHSPNGGLGSVVAEVMAEMGAGVPLVRAALPEFLNSIGDQAFLRSLARIDAAGIGERVRELS